MKQFFFPKTISLISSSKPCSTFIMNRGRSRGWLQTSPSSSTNNDSPNHPIQDHFPQIGRPQESRSSQWDVESNRSKNPHEMKVVDYSSDPRRPYQNASRGKGMTSRAKSPDRVIQQKGRASVKLSPKRKMSPKREDGQHTDTKTIPPFHICVKPHGPPVLKPSLFVSNRQKRGEIERSINNDPRKTILRPGMVLLKNYISLADQIKIIKICEQLGGEDGFYQPGYNDGAKLRLHMMCLGKDWDPEQRSYGDIRSDGFKPPIIPAELKEIVSGAILASHAKMRDLGEKNPHEAVPCMEADICIVNFYTNSGKLGLHQDRDESAESIEKGLPVVSFSIGDSAEFLYGDDRDPEQAKKVELKSGDVVIFGGKSRLIFHGVPSIIPDSAPKVLAEKANLRPGRLNLTFRKF